MLSLSVSTNAASFEKEFREFADQLPYALATALNYTATDVQGYLVDHLRDHFEIRSRWVPGSIKIRKAQKGPSPVAYVGSIYEPMALQVDGGQKRGSVAVPAWARRNESQITKPNQWPSALLKKKRFAVGPFGREGVGYEAEPGAPIGVFERIGRGKNQSFRLWWILKSSVTIRPRWPFAEEATFAIKMNFADNFGAAMEQARATARRRPGQNP